MKPLWPEGSDDSVNYPPGWKEICKWKGYLVGFFSTEENWGNTAYRYLYQRYRKVGLVP